MPDSHRLDPLQIARTGAWFATLSEDFAAALLDISRVLTLPAGQQLFARGDAPDGVYCILRGMVRISAVAENGAEPLLAMIGPPQWFGEIAVFDGAPRTHDAWAEADCELLHAPHAALLALLQRHPTWWRELGLLMTHKLRITFAAVEELAVLPATARVAARLATLASGYGAWTDRSKRTLEVSQEQLGQMLALSRQTVNQSLRDLETAGALRRSRGAIEIVDLDMLRGWRERR